MRNLGMKLAISLLIGGLIAAIATPAGAWPVGLDFITGGGFIFTPPPPYSVTSVPGSRANFGWPGGVTHGGWWGIALFYGGSLIYLNQNFLSGGNIQLHKGNRSNTAPSAPPSCDSLPDPFAFT